MFWNSSNVKGQKLGHFKFFVISKTFYKMLAQLFDVLKKVVGTEAKFPLIFLKN